MEVILLEKVAKLGDLGEKVSVRSGYGRNFLIPTRKAIPATADNLAEFEKQRAEFEKAQAESLAAAEKRAEAINAMTITIARNAGDEGKLFGSVTPADIAEAVTEAGTQLEKREVRLPTGPLHEIGEYEIDVHLHADVNATVKIEVVPEEG